MSDLVIDEDARVATRGGELLQLTRTEFAVLADLARHRGAPVSKDQLLELVWGGTATNPTSSSAR